jgi:hypothetical protein
MDCYNFYDAWTDDNAVEMIAAIGRMNFDFHEFVKGTEREQLPGLRREDIARRKSDDPK